MLINVEYVEIVNSNNPVQFGRCQFDILGDIAFISIKSSLSESIKKAVLAHEMYHAIDRSRNVHWREIKANLHALSVEPVGFFRHRMKEKITFNVG